MSIPEAQPPHNTVAVIGAGPAGLMAAEPLAAAGLQVHVFDAMPSVARKFLLAGVGGMNITHAEPYAHFTTRYREASPYLLPMLDAFTPDDLREWIHQLGLETFVGSSNRVFPKDMKAAPLLRAWLHRLREQGVTFHARHRWQGPLTSVNDKWCFETPSGAKQFSFDAVVFALGGASWARLGSDGAWVQSFIEAGIEVSSLKPSNCGFELPWGHFLKERFAGTPIKNVALRLANSKPSQAKQGEFIVSHYGIEGSLVYALSAELRLQHEQDPENAYLVLDWLVQLDEAAIVKKLAQSRKGESFTNKLRKKLKLPSIAPALIKECCPSLNTQDDAAVAQALKAMRLPRVTNTRPIDEAISSAGGVVFRALTDELMLKQRPGIFIAGEMLDWEAPTGGYLLTACFATGRWAGNNAARWVIRDSIRS